MSTDPIQLLIDAGAIPSEPFDPMSRYRGVPLALFERGAGEPPLPFVRRRFIPQRRDISIAVEATVAAFDRPDLLAARALGEPLLYWRIADANAVADPFELSDRPGERVAIPGGAA
ncbi:hypothetical protein GCM10027084_16620 [Pseudoxanthomonas sangjuensis]|uniref:Base plate wedge protein 53 n=1 Tax=Pseudoxanthomonas sangjuensis TaxID=1503750 RepID=UPI0013916DF1|nr:Base plate wedge protein 53 [Pseudoxanthomonas sangjuensis]KAF1709693.1 Base plate wedge protein 53 [Pseudoxanthomonas sangjuensis]